MTTTHTTIQGLILEVSILPSGSKLTADHPISSTVLNVGDATAFDETGGGVTILGIPYTYISADLEADTITLSSGLTTAVPEATSVMLNPPGEEKWAMVDQELGEDMIMARVPHWLADKIPDGIREESDREAVTLSLEYAGWTVTDVVGQQPITEALLNDAITAAIEAQATADTAQTAANGKNSVYYSINPPGTAANSAGDIWWQRDPANLTQFIAMWIGQGGTAWASTTLRNEVITNLDAAKITSGYLDVANRIQAGSIVTPLLAAEAITAEKIALGVLKRNLINDPGFEEAYALDDWDPFISGQGTVTRWRNAKPGATAGRAAVRTTVAGRARSGQRALELTCGVSEAVTAITNTFAVIPGQEYRLVVNAASLLSVGNLSVDVQVAATQGGIAGFAPLTLTGDSAWNLAPVLVTEPIDPEGFDTFSWSFTPGVSDTWAAVRIYNTNPAALSTIVIDDVSVIMVGLGGASELTSAGLRLFDDDGYEVTALVSNRKNYFSVQSKGVTLASINQAGEASFPAATIRDDVNIQGQRLVGANFLVGLSGGQDSPYPDSILENLPMGLAQWGGLYTTPLGTSASTTGVGILEIGFPLFANRMYKICTNAVRVRSTVVNDAAELRVHATYGTVGDPDAVPTTPLVASTPQMARSPITTINNTSGEAMTLTKLWNPGAGSIADNRFYRNTRLLLAVARVLGTGTVSVDGTTLDPVEFWVEDIGPFKENGGQANAGGGGTTAPPPQTYVKTFTSTGAKCYMGNNSADSSQGVSDMKQGYSSYDGDSKSVWVFPSMTSTLAGATVTRIRVYLYANHWYYNSGGTAKIDVHGASSLPASWPPVSLANGVDSTGWPKPGGRWVTLPTSLHAGFIAGTYKGIAVGPAGTTNLLYYGRFNRDGAKIEVTYKK